MKPNPPKEWFEMRDLRARKLSRAIWIPLRQSEVIDQSSEQDKPGTWQEFYGVGSVAILTAHRQEGEALGWSDIGLIHDPSPFAFADGRYKSAEAFLDRNERDTIGIDLVVVNRLNSAHPREWHLNQDLVLALHLIEEGDVWRSVNEGYIDVARRRRGKKGRVVAIEIRAEFLRDYLCARGAALRLVTYRQRAAIADTEYIQWTDAEKHVETADQKFQAGVSPIAEDGGLLGDVHVMKVWRTDVDSQDDVPVFDTESDSNTAHESSMFNRGGAVAHRFYGEVWRQEWVDPAPRSERVRRDDPSEDLYFVIEASGQKAKTTELNHEDVGRWLWFRSQVIEVLVEQRASELTWYTAETGQVKGSPDYGVHFGVNAQDRINVYAYDIAKLPRWLQLIWAGHNIAPDGPVCSELLDAQMRASPANTSAHEEDFANFLGLIDRVFVSRYGQPLFRHHEQAAEILRRIHRFRAQSQAGLLELAKDVARLTADSIDLGLLRKVAPPSDPSKPLGSLKHLEHLLAQFVAPDRARRIMTPLVGIYELRLGDAHLPSKKLEEAFGLAGIDPKLSPMKQAVQLLYSACRGLFQSIRVLDPKATVR